MYELVGEQMFRVTSRTAIKIKTDFRKYNYTILWVEFFKTQN